MTIKGLVFGANLRQNSLNSSMLMGAGIERNSLTSSIWCRLSTIKNTDGKERSSSNCLCAVVILEQRRIGYRVEKCTRAWYQKTPRSEACNCN